MGGALSALRHRVGPAGVVSAAGLFVVLGLLRRLQRGTPLELRHLQSLLEDLQAGRVAHLEFGPDAILVLLKAAEAAAASTVSVGGGSDNAVAHAKSVGDGAGARAYGVRVLPFLFQATAARIAALMLEHRVSFSEMRQSLAQRLSFLLVLVPFAYLVAMYFVMKRIMNPTESMKKKVRVAKSASARHRLPTFADVAGIEKAKVEMRELVSMLRDPLRYRQLGARLPRGYLLVGPSGTGKTLLAKAVAGEAHAAFFQCTASDFVETLVGRGAARVRELFDRAAAVRGPAIVFIDELDALGKKRGQLNSHDEREQTLNQLLTAMDGFETRVAADGSVGNSIVVIAATNRVDVLDPALIRPGRFDTHIHVGLCGRAGRQDILRVHLSKVRATPSLDVAGLAARTRGFSGADLAALVQDATRLAARRGRDEVGVAEFEDALTRGRRRFGAPEDTGGGGGGRRRGGGAGGGAGDSGTDSDSDSGSSGDGGGGDDRGGSGRRGMSLDIGAFLSAIAAGAGWRRPRGRQQRRRGTVGGDDGEEGEGGGSGGSSGGSLGGGGGDSGDRADEGPRSPLTAGPPM